jgi:TatD DNase family protein
MVLTDSHAHLALAAEELGHEALAAVLEAYARDSALTGALLVDIGVDPGDLGPRLAALGPGEAGLPPFLRVSAGIWPSARNLASSEASLAGLMASIEEAESRGIRVAAIGEGGLDYHYDEGPKEAQARLFEGLLGLASSLSLPVIVHSREAAADTLAAIERTRPDPPALIHCFGYGADEARAFLGLGCYISFAGNLTYKNSDSLREALALVPDDRLLLETDSPYMNPMPRRGRPSSPLDVERTYTLAAELRGVAVAELAETVSLNARLLFG